MFMHYKHLFVCLFTIWTYIGPAVAAGYNQECTEGRDCTGEPGLYCKGSGINHCWRCDNASHIEDVYYIGYAYDDQGITCPWFVQLDEYHAGQKTGTNSYTIVECGQNQKSLAGYFVYYDGVIYQDYNEPVYGNDFIRELVNRISQHHDESGYYYFVPLEDGEMLEATEQIPQCTYEPYEVDVNCAGGHTNSHGYCNGYLYRQYENATGWFYNESDVYTSGSGFNQLEIPTKNCSVFNGFYDTNNTMVFSPTGVSQTSIDNPIITGPGTITAQWNAANYNIRLFKDNNEVPASQTSCSCGDASCSLQYTGCADGTYLSGASFKDLNYAVCGGVSVSNGTTVTLAMNNRDSCPILPNQTYIDISMTVDDCPAGYYCTECQKHQCTDGKTSDGGRNATSPKACYYGADTIYTDTHGGSFKLPVKITTVSQN